MIDLEILDHCGSSNAALKEFFTCEMPKAHGDDGRPVDVHTDEYKNKEKRYKLRRKYEERISNRLNADLTFSLKNFQFYSAVDLAWEPPPIAPALYPMLLYAQGKLNLAACANQLNALGCADQFCQRNEKKEVIGINLPKFCEVSINLVRSIITRRLAAQSNRYSDLYPYFKYESRDTSQVGKLRSDLMSQRSDIMADQYGYEAHDEQVLRDMLLYGHQVDFIRCAWERELQWARKPKPEEDRSTKLEYEAVVVREGLSWINPHPTRIYYDNAYPLSSINEDNGCEYIGFWDVLRYKNVAQNEKYWNRKNVGYNSEYLSLFTNYATFFNQYFCTITPPTPTGAVTDLTSANDRRNWVGVYSGDESDASIVVSNHFEKIVPKEWGIGNYPYPVWVRHLIAGWDTVMYAEFLPSTPGAYDGYNQKDDRRLNLGMGHELLTYQDHMSNLTTALLMALKEHVRIIVIDIDTLTPEERQQMKKDAKGDSLYTEVKVLEVSRSKLQEMNLKIEDVIDLVETKGGSERINAIFQAMLHLMTMVERLAALSPQEQGQPAPREISATETNLIAGTTESVYNFVSNAHDRFRNAKKRIIYDSLINFGEPQFRVPIVNRYPKKVIEAAGLQIVDPESTGNANDPASQLLRGTIIGSKRKLIHDYIFTSRDGAERTSNSQGAQYITELLKSILPIPAVQEQMTKTQLFDMLNELFRMGGSYDLRLEADEGGDEPLSPAASEQLDAQLEQITNIIGKNSTDIQGLLQALSKLGASPNGNGQAGSTVPLRS